jgi:hypothetical protein
MASLGNKIGARSIGQNPPESRKRLLKAIVAEGLAIQERFRPEPLYKTTGRGSYRSESAAEIGAAKKLKK